MSRDDDDNHTFNYEIMHPTSTRNRNRRSEKPRSKEQMPAPSIFSPKDVRKKISGPQSSTSRHLGRRDIDGDGRPMRSMKIVTREMLAKDPALTTDELMEQLEAMGYEAAPGTISSLRQDFIDVLRSCEKFGTIIVRAWQD